LNIFTIFPPLPSDQLVCNDSAVYDTAGELTILTPPLFTLPAPVLIVNAVPVVVESPINALPITSSLLLGVVVPKPTKPLFANIISPVPSASIK